MLSENIGGDPDSLMYLLDGIFSYGDEKKIVIGLTKLAGMDSDKIVALASKSSSSTTSHLSNALKSKASWLRKVMPIFDKFGEVESDALLDRMMKIVSKSQESYDDDAEAYYDEGDDDVGGC